MLSRLFAAVVAVTCFLAAVATVSAATPAQELADRYAPIVALKAQEEPCDDKGEPYRPTSVEMVLGNPDVKLRGPGRGHPVVTTAPTAADLYGKGLEYFLDFPGNPLKPGCRFETDGRRFDAGLPSLAYAHIVTQPEEFPGQLALQYWFFYYFNDYNNKHESDWEGIQVVFDASTPEEALAEQPVEVGYAQHEGGESAEWDSDKLERVGDHPVVYPGAGSHASYFSNALWLGASADEGIGCDDTDARVPAGEARRRRRADATRAGPRADTPGSHSRAAGDSSRVRPTTGPPGRIRSRAGPSRSPGRRTSARSASAYPPAARSGRA